MKRFTTRAFLRAIFLFFFVLVMISDAAWGQKLNPMARILLNQNIDQNGISYPLTFAIMSDNHVGCSRPSKKDGGGCCVNKINECSCNDAIIPLLGAIGAKRPVFVLSLGDITECGSSEEYSLYRDAVHSWMNTSQIPVFTVPGNHDLPPTCYGLPWEHDGHYWYKQMIDDVQYTGSYKNQSDHAYWDYYFDYGDFRFVMIDNMQKEGYWGWSDGRVTSAQQARIDIWLSGNPPQHLLFMHNPLALNYSGYAVLDSAAQAVSVRAIYQGHQHHYEFQDYNELDCADHFLVPAGCPRLGNEEKISGFLLVTLGRPYGGTSSLFTEYHQYISANQEWRTNFHTHPITVIPGATITSAKQYVGQELRVGGNLNPFIIEATGDVEFRAADSIILKPGFSVRHGGKMNAKVKSCGSP